MIRNATMAEGDILELGAVVFDTNAAPRHVALIMDGNGRWAAARGLPRFEGHRRGVEALRRAVRAAIELNISFLTVYSFSVENWSRPPEEVRSLLGLLHRFIRNDLAELQANNVRVRVIGARADLASDVAALLREAEQVTAANTGLTLVVAFNYGARQEIAAARARRDVSPSTRSTPTRFRRGSTPRTFPIRISSSAPRASSACRISCCGRRLTPNSCSCPSIGRISTRRLSRRPSPIMRTGIAGLGVSRRQAATRRQPHERVFAYGVDKTAKASETRSAAA